jgi:hypothetical protein
MTPPDPLHELTAFLAVQTEFTARCSRRVDVFVDADDDVRGNIAAVLIDRRLYLTLSKVENLCSLADDYTPVQRTGRRLGPRLIFTNPFKGRRSK